MTFPIFYSLPGGIDFNFQPDVEHWIVWMPCIFELHVYIYHVHLPMLMKCENLRIELVSTCTFEPALAIFATYNLLLIALLSNEGSC